MPPTRPRLGAASELAPDAGRILAALCRHLPVPPAALVATAHAGHDALTTVVSSQPNPRRRVLFDHRAVADAAGLAAADPPAAGSHTYGPLLALADRPERLPAAAWEPLTRHDPAGGWDIDVLLPTAAAAPPPTDLWDRIAAVEPASLTPGQRAAHVAVWAGAPDRTAAAAAAARLTAGVDRDGIVARTDALGRLLLHADTSGLPALFPWHDTPQTPGRFDDESLLAVAIDQHGLHDQALAARGAARRSRWPARRRPDDGEVWLELLAARLPAALERLRALHVNPTTAVFLTPTAATLAAAWTRLHAHTLTDPAVPTTSWRPDLDVPGRLPLAPTGSYHVLHATLSTLDDVAAAAAAVRLHDVLGDDPACWGAWARIVAAGQLDLDTGLDAFAAAWGTHRA